MSSTSYRNLKLERLECRELLSFAAASMCALAGEDGIGVIAVDHLNSDSHLDIVIASEFSNVVNVLYGTGDSQCAPAVSLNSGGKAAGVDVGDLNGDGKKDIVMAIGSNAAVMLNNGDGTFRPPENWSVGTGGRDVALDDYDSDGDTDIAVLGSTTIRILLNNGTGGFATAASYAGGVNSQSMAVADFDNDGDQDIAVANFNLGGTISVIMGLGDGTFLSPRRYRTGGREPRKITVGDYDGDGHVDIAVSNRGSDKVGVLLNKGDGTYQRPATYDVGPSLYGITSADFDGNGHDDIAVATWDSYGKVHVLLSNADGTLQSAVSYATAIISRDISFGDFNADGIIDLVYTNAAVPIQNAVAVLRGRGDGAFIAATTYQVVNNPIGMEIGHFNADGIQDLIVVDNPNVRVLFGNGDGTFGLPITSNNSFSDVISVGDLNADGFSDLVTANVNASFVQVLLSQGDGTFGASVSYPVGDNPNWVTIADFDADGNLDLAVTNFTSENISLLLGNGDGTFEPPVFFPVAASPGDSVAGDFNNDGALDLAVGHFNFPPGNLSILLGNGDGTFLPAMNFDPGGVVYDITVGDFGGDGKLDLAVTRSNSNFFNLHVLTGNGDGTFSPPLLYSTPEFANDLAAADFNLDGIHDLAIGYGYGFQAIYLGQPSGFLQTPFAYDSLAYAARSITVGDFDADSFPDIATVNGGALGIVPSNVAILMNEGNWPAPLPSRQQVATRGSLSLFRPADSGSASPPTSAVNVDVVRRVLDNGGPTLTMALLPGSPAIDAGDPNPVDPPEWDQRGPGFPRIVNGRLDIGAFEVQATGAPPSHDLAALVTADFETIKTKRWK